MTLKNALRWAAIISVVPMCVFGKPLEIKTEVSYAGEAMRAIKALQHSFAAASYRLEITSWSTAGGEGRIVATASGMRPLSTETLKKMFAASGIRLQRFEASGGKLSLDIDARDALWGVPSIEVEEGAQLERVSVPQWFRVTGGQTIRIEAPYGGEWYPEVSILDSEMAALLTLRSTEAREELEIALPPEARYLKVSNTWGMKLLQEGMWIESKSAGR